MANKATAIEFNWVGSRTGDEIDEAALVELRPRLSRPFPGKNRASREFKPSYGSYPRQFLGGAKSCKRCQISRRRTELMPDLEMADTTLVLDAKLLEQCIDERG